MSDISDSIEETNFHNEDTIKAETYVSYQIAIVWLLLIVTVCITYLLQKYKVSRLLPPSIGAMILGMTVGIVVNSTKDFSPPAFSPEAFLYGLLPPIVFQAGFNMKKKSFFANFGAICLFAIVGTVLSTIVFSVLTLFLVAVGAVNEKKIGEESILTKVFLYGSLISAIDPVATLSVFSELDAPPLLYNLVFGESVLNDAVAIVLFRTFEELLGKDISFATIFEVIGKFLWISSGSLAIGIVVTLICAYTLKRFSFHLSDLTHIDGTIYEISIVFMGAYMAYVTAEVFKFSGIVALFFSGIIHAHYSYHNISADSQTATTKISNVLAFLCEIFVFVYLGLQVALISKESVDVGLLVSGIPLCIISRAVNIFLLAYIINKFRRFPIPFPVQTMQFACGLRGAVAYALAAYLTKIAQPSKTIETGTLVIVVVSTLLFGGGTGPLMRSLKLQGTDDSDLRGMGYDEINSGNISTAEFNRLNQEEIEQISAFQLKIENFDNKYLKPFFGGRINQNIQTNTSRALLTRLSNSSPDLIPDYRNATM